MRWKRSIKPPLLLLIFAALTGAIFWLRTDGDVPKKAEVNLNPERVAAAIVGRQFYLVNQEGLVLAKSDSPPANPLIFLEPEVNLEIGQEYSPPTVLFLLKLIREMEMRLLEPKMIKVQDLTRYSFWLADDTEVIFSDKKDVGEQLDSLQLILARSKMEGRSVKRIDLRYSKPVVSQ